VTRRILWLVLAIAVYCAIGAAFAHDSWISRGALRNPAGEWCCGEGDCFIVRAHVQGNGSAVIFGAAGEILEIVPAAEVQPSGDGQFWRCRRADGSRRCFFAPPPGS
jgi:hypothetical protein